MHVCMEDGLGSDAPAHGGDNWPISSAIGRFLASIGEPVVPLVREVAGSQLLPLVYGKIRRLPATCLGKRNLSAWLEGVPDPLALPSHVCSQFVGKLAMELQEANVQVHVQELQA